MQYAKAIGADVKPNSFNGIAIGVGILVTVLMVLSGFSSVFLAGSVGVASAPVHSTAGVANVNAPSAAAHQASSPSPTVASLAQRQALATKMANEFKASGVSSKDYFPPNILGPGAVQKAGVVTPLYNIAPAPMGIGDFGITNTTGTAVGSITNTSSIQADMNLNSLNTIDLMNDGSDQVTFQLNTVVVNTNVGNNTTGQYWIQNVPFYTTTTGILYMEDNVWNLSSYGAGLPLSTLTGTSTTDPHGTGGFYYTSVQIGVVAMPFTIQLYNNVTVASPSTSPYKNYSTEVQFGYNIIKGGKSVHSGIFDSVFFTSTATKAPTTAPRYQINGKACSDFAIPGFCLLLDAELMIGGPGGGSGTNVFNINATMSLSTWDATTSAWVLAQSAYGYGTDTGETSDGIGEWWTTAGTVNLGPGPSILFPLWNASKTSTIGDMKITGGVTPSNAFLFFNQGNTTTFADSTASWAPVPVTGLATYNLPPGNYSIKALFSDYTAKAVNLTVTLPAFAISMTKDTALGITTPLFADGNAQLANISTGGSGTLASPYLIENQQFTSIDPEFNQYNDYGFAVFPGMLIWDSTAYADLNNPAPLTMTYVAPWLRAVTTPAAQGGWGLSASSDQPMEIYNASHVTIWGGASISGWFPPTPSFAGGFPTANVLLWNATDTLIGDNHFVNDGMSPSILVYNPGTAKSNNTIWGNTFDMNSTATPSAPMGIVFFSSDNQFYNNIVNTYPTAYSPTADIYNGNPETYSNAWNVSMQSALNVHVFNGYVLSGNIMGYNWQGGNDWIDYTCAVPLPYDEGAYPYTTPGLISHGGDFLPINYPTACSPALSTYYAVTYTESGVTAGLAGAADGSWTLTVASNVTGYETSTTTNTSSITLYLTAGAYNYTASTTVSGYFFAAALGTNTVTKAGGVTVAFEADPTVTVAPTTGVTNNAYLGATNVNFGVIVSASAAAAAAVTTEFAVSAASGVSGSGVNPSGAACPAADWFAEAIPTANSSVLVSITNTTSLLNFCIPSGSSDLPYGGLFASVTMTYMTADPMSGIMTPATFPVVSSGEIFHVYAAITGPAPNQVFLAGNVTISYGVIWAEASARTLIVSGPVGFSTVSIPIAGSTVSGNLTLSLSVPGTYTVELATNDTANVANGYPQAFANVTTTFSVAQAPPNIVIIYNNSTKTSTTYVNTTEAPAGISVGALGAILIVVGIIVGALIGYLFLAPKNRGGKPSSPEPWSGPASGGKTQ